MKLERLDDRCTPSTSGVTWPDGNHLTLSLTRDGTDVTGLQSELFHELNAVAPTSIWQREILRAFQTWASYSNLNIGMVMDGGQAHGVTGAVQGDTRFGDIRVSGVPLPAGTLMTNTAFQWTGTTWSGDIVINTSYDFSIGESAGKYDLYTCMLNEAGNVLGVVDNTTDPTSAVYSNYVGVKSNINAADIADIRSLYGARSVDRFDTQGSNGSFSTATVVSGGSNQNNEADITTVNDVDFYKFTIPLSLPLINGFQVHVLTDGISGLLPAVNVYNGFQSKIGSDTAIDPLDNDLSVEINQVGLLATYYVRVSSNVPGAFGVGGYKLVISFRHSNGLISNLLGGLTSLVFDNHLNDTLASATNLTPNYVTKPDARFDVFGVGVIEDANDVDFYQIRSPQITTGTQKLNVLVWPDKNSSLVPKIEVYTSAGQLVPYQLLANENGTFSIEIANMPSLSTYYLKVMALHSTGSRALGSYQFGANFSTQSVTHIPVPISGVLTSANRPLQLELNVRQNQLMQFALGGTSATPLTELRMKVFRQGVFQFAMQFHTSQNAVTQHEYMKAGRYTLEFVAVPKPGTVFNNVTFQFWSRKVSDPIGPQKDQGTGPNAGPGTKTEPKTGPNSAQKDWESPYYF